MILTGRITHLPLMLLLQLLAAQFQAKMSRFLGGSRSSGPSLPASTLSPSLGCCQTKFNTLSFVSKAPNGFAPTYLSEVFRSW